MDPTKQRITVKEWCELQLFMIANGYSSEAIRIEKNQYVFVNGPILSGDMAQQFNDAQEYDDCFDEQDPMGL